MTLVDEVVGRITVVDEVVGRITVVEDEDTPPPLHEPKRGLHPFPQYSAELPQYQYGEQHCPKPDPVHTVLLPHIPFVEIIVPDGKGGPVEVLDVVGTITDVEDEVVLVLEDVLDVEDVVGGSTVDVLLVVGVGVGVGVGGTEVVGRGSPSHQPYAG
ncbi:hypothetical protein ONS95_014467 [Cadophora gregata]|uniref:uncharacterized protein n=1 Tax=Cadophora gregata TaxID=51156 RepID=UPI0026DD084B|nr:uncharacterized protein ONS95_014467 [Cadophora gregata]KAK0112731.1 hypothetical protein ONS95_014467 [Cadophora gregata]